MRRMARIWTGRVNVTGRSCRRSLPRQSESTAGAGRPCVNLLGWNWSPLRWLLNSCHQGTFSYFLPTSARKCSPSLILKRNPQRKRGFVPFEPGMSSVLQGEIHVVRHLSISQGAKPSNAFVVLNPVVDIPVHHATVEHCSSVQYR